MKISARNQLAGKVVKVIQGLVNGEVTIELPGGDQITAIITKTSIKNLGIKKGATVVAVVKASDVLLAMPCDNPACNCGSRSCSSAE